MSTILVILSAVVNSLWQALAVAVLVWLALRFMPRINAATRYAIWWAALGVVLILPVAPRLILLARSHPKTVAITAVTPKTVVPAVTVEPVIVTVAPGRTAIWPIVVLIVWAALLLWRLFQIVRSYFYLRGVKRRAAVSSIPLPAIPRRADLLISPDIVSPMAVGFLRPAVVLPESLLEELSEPEREHVLLHESAHLAKYDDWSNLAMRLLAGALALHPVAIWILWRIEREREMACDDWVVARTGAARSYAASLAHLFELRRARRGEILASGIFGHKSRVGDRIEMILRRGRTFSPRTSVTDIAASAVVLAGLMLAGSLAPRWIAFAQQYPGAVFEAASVRPNASDGRMWIHFPPGGRVDVAGQPLRTLILVAYNLRSSQLSGGPSWIDSQTWDIAAKSDSGATFPQARIMLQKLLEDRFKLGLRPETREAPVYDLEAAKGGLRLTPSRIGNCVAVEGDSVPPPARPGEAPPTYCGNYNSGQGRLEVYGTRMQSFSFFLSNLLDRTVVDKTGFSGTFDIHLEYTPDQATAGGPGPVPGASVDPSGPPSIFTALQEQMGLRLQSSRGPVRVLVIDHVEKPDAN